MSQAASLTMFLLLALGVDSVSAREHAVSDPQPPAGVEQLPTGGFAFRQEVVLPVDPVRAYDYFNGDISAWWDHSFSEKPRKLYIDARPGGGFYEIFDEQGNGAQHAVVIFAQRGKRLTLRGPLGLSGSALDMVFSLEFRPDARGTLLVMQARAAGQLEAAWGESVAGVWQHFLVERLLPYVQQDCRVKGVCVENQ
jgi:hypothetical protein